MVKEKPIALKCKKKRQYKILNLKNFITFLLIFCIVINIGITYVNKYIMSVFNSYNAQKQELPVKEEKGEKWEIDYITTSPDKQIYYYHMTDGSIQTYYCTAR